MIAALVVALGAAQACSSATPEAAAPVVEPAEQVAPQAKGSAEHIRAVTARVDDTAINLNGLMSLDWPSHGLDYSETRFSPLNQINDENVKELGLAWPFNRDRSRASKRRRSSSTA